MEPAGWICRPSESYVSIRRAGCASGAEFDGPAEGLFGAGEIPLLQEAEIADPRFDPVAWGPRFAGLMKQLHLPPAQ